LNGKTAQYEEGGGPHQQRKPTGDREPERGETRAGGGSHRFFSFIGARRHKAAAVQKRTNHGYGLSSISFEDVHDGFAALNMNAAGAEHCTEAMHMLVRRPFEPRTG
jgi:hypothetical protein